MTVEISLSYVERSRTVWTVQQDGIPYSSCFCNQIPNKSHSGTKSVFHVHHDGEVREAGMGAAGPFAFPVRRSSMTDTGLVPCLFSVQHPSSSDGATHTQGGLPTYECNLVSPGDRTSDWLANILLRWESSLIITETPSHRRRRDKQNQGIPDTVCVAAFLLWVYSLSTV